MVKTTVRKLVPLQPIRLMVEQLSACSLQGTAFWRWWMQGPVDEGGCEPMGNSCWSRLLAGPVILWRQEPMLEQVCWQDL